MKCLKNLTIIEMLVCIAILFIVGSLILSAIGVLGGKEVPQSPISSMMQQKERFDIISKPQYMPGSSSYLYVIKDTITGKEYIVVKGGTLTEIKHEE